MILQTFAMKYIITTFTFWASIINSGICQTVDTLVDVGGYRLYFHIIKGTGMPILFEGGAGGDVTDWDTILKPLSDITHATLITYDRAGFGKSELDTSNNDVDKHGILDGMKGLEIGLKKLGYGGNIMLVAHSYGGFCATLYAARHPSQVKSAVFIDANHVSWFIDSYVENVMKMRNDYWANNKPTNNWADFYAGLNLERTVRLMRQTPFPATIPVIDMVSEYNFPDSAMAARWRSCHEQFAAAEPNRQGIFAHGCGHFIFRDNLLLAVGAIVKEYTGAQSEKQAGEIMQRFLSYSVPAANEEKRKEVQYRHSGDDLTSWGKSLLQKGDKEKAIEVLNLNASFNPENGDAFERLAEAYESAGEKDLAIKNYKRSLELNPDNKNAEDHLKKLSSSVK